MIVDLELLYDLVLVLFFVPIKANNAKKKTRLRWLPCLSLTVLLFFMSLIKPTRIIHCLATLGSYQVDGK
jgi:hypothetical protein